MAKGIGIIFNADADEVVDESKRVQKALGGVDDELDNVGTSAQASEKKQTDALDRTARSAEDLGDTVGKDTAGGFEDLAGKAEGALGGIGDDLMGLAGLAGGVGGAVSTLVGGSIDFVTGLIKDQQDAAAKLKADLIDAYKSAADAGLSYLDTAGVIQKAIDLQADPSKMDEFRKAAELIGIDVNTYLLAQAGSYEDLQIVIEATKAAEETRGQVTGDRTKAGQAAALQEAHALDVVIGKNEALLATHEEGKDLLNRTAELRDAVGQRERDQIQRTRDADQARYDALAEQHQKASELPPVTLRTDVQVPDVDSIFDGLQRKLAGKTLTVKAGVVDRTGQRIDG